MISVIIPVYNEEGTVQELHQRITEVFSRQSEEYEIIFINDGSIDATLTIIKTLRPVKWIALQKNYGATPALNMGIQAAQGETIVFLDADLQNDPSDIPLFLQKLREGNDVVMGWRKKRYDAWNRLIFSRLSNFLVRLVLNVKIHDFGCGIKVFRSRFIKEFYLWGDMQIFLVAVAKERGAVISEVEVSHNPRRFGVSKIKISRMIRAVFDLLAVKFMVKYFTKPMRFFGGWGLFFTMVAILVFSWSIFLKVNHLKDFSTTPLPIIGVLFTLLGILLFMMGFLAEILLRLFYDRKNSSPYFIRESGENF